eukprot:2831894-Pyramimonas_sp.AAC.2
MVFASGDAAELHDHDGGPGGPAAGPGGGEGAPRPGAGEERVDPTGGGEQAAAEGDRGPDPQRAQQLGGEHPRGRGGRQGKEEAKGSNKREPC